MYTAHSTLKTLAAIACAISLSGCAVIGKHVNAYERSTLSKEGMALVQNPKELALQNHMINASEGSVGGVGGAGGGCGCN
jgi:hypothetical protein